MTSDNGKQQNGNGQTNAGPTVDYEYDVFLSYSYTPLVKQWVNDRFLQLFEFYLQNALVLPLRRLPRVYVAEREMQAADHWMNVLGEKLRRSKVLVAVCSPIYFFSGWCLSEWESFNRRMKFLEDSGLQLQKDLRVPLLHNDGEHYINTHLNNLQFVDFRNVIYFAPGGDNDPKALLFQAEVQKLALAVAAAVLAAPPFDPQWPVLELDDAGTPKPDLQRLKPAQEAASQ